MIIDYSLVIIAVCMVVLVGVAVVIGVSLHKSLKNIDLAVTAVELKLDIALDDVSTTLTQTSEAISNLNQITASVKDKLELTDPLFESIAKAGVIMASFLSMIPEREPKPSRIFNFSTNGHRKRHVDVEDIVDLVGVGINVWQKLKKRV